MPRPVLFGALCLSAWLATACGTSPPSHFYTLTPTAASTGASSSLLVAVGPVTVPAVVDRPEIVLREGANGLRLDDFNRWASPLQDNLSRVIAENLVLILGTPRVILFPQPLAVDPDFRVAVEIRAFDSVPGSAAAVDAVWTLRRTRDGLTQTGRSTAREPVGDGSYEALAGAHSRAVARLSLDIANAIATLQAAR